jgi:phosphotransferase system HPr (HPr) family protein
LPATADEEKIENTDRCAAMQGEPLRRQVIIRNPEGLHMRPATAFAQACRRFQCMVSLTCGERRAADGRDGFALLMLAAEPGAEVLLEVAGPDAAEAIEVLTAILEAPEPPMPTEGPAIS